MAYTKVTDIKIYETTHYDQFVKLSSNRPVSRNKALETAIKKENKLKYNPMIVTPAMEILDGQHRLDIAQRLQTPIYYIIDNEGQEDDSQKMNIGNRNWTLEDHLHFFSDKGIYEYQILKNCLSIFPVKASLLIECFSISYAKKTINEFKSGKLKLKVNEHQIKDILNKYEELLDLFKHYSNKHIMSKRMQTNLIQIIQHPNYDHNRFINAIHRYPDEFIKANAFNERETCMRVLLDNIYNKNRNEENRIYM